MTEKEFRNIEPGDKIVLVLNTSRIEVLVLSTNDSMIYLDSNLSMTKYYYGKKTLYKEAKIINGIYLSSSILIKGDKL